VYRAESWTTGGAGDLETRGVVLGRFEGVSEGDGDETGVGDTDGDGDAVTVITICGSAATDVALGADGRPMPSAPITTAHTTAPATASAMTDQNDGVLRARCFATGPESTVRDQDVASRRPFPCRAGQ
jgi:hypothetical protein